MNNPWGKTRRLQATYVGGYLALLMFCISGLLIQGGIAMLAGIIAFSSVSLILTACLLRSKSKRAHVISQ